MCTALDTIFIDWATRLPTRFSQHTPSIDNEMQTNDRDSGIFNYAEPMQTVTASNIGWEYTIKLSVPRANSEKKIWYAAN